MRDACNYCPRSNNGKGCKIPFCGDVTTFSDAQTQSSGIRLAAACLHFGEEPPITGDKGSGTVFLSGCNLHCVFCQNYQISQNGMGRVVSINEFADICLQLQNLGGENINIVTGSHAIPEIKAGIELARNPNYQHSPLTIPCLWNSGAYETVAAVELIDTFADAYLPDLKTLDSEISYNFFNAANYPSVASDAILAMIKTTKPVIIRHLVLPGFLEATKKVLEWIAHNLKDNVKISLMTQYTPIKNSISMAKNVPDRYLSDMEYEQLLEWIEFYDIDGFYQELELGNEWLPDFENAKPFPTDLCKMVWHWGNN